MGQVMFVLCLSMQKKSSSNDYVQIRGLAQIPEWFSSMALKEQISAFNEADYQQLL